MSTEEKGILYAILITALALAVVLGLFVYLIVRQQIRYRKLATAKIRAEITALENERKRLASDLHDEVGPLLSAIKIQINHLEHTNDHDKKLVEKSSGHIDDVIKKIREICNNLLPNVLVRKGVAAAITDFIEKTSGSTPTKISFENMLTDRLPQGIEINVYRIILEIIHNTLKHAQAANLRIQLAKDDRNYRLASEDDGIGFQMAKALGGAGGLGLLNLQSRAEVMGAEFTFDSKPGKGTRYLFEIPLQP